MKRLLPWATIPTLLPETIRSEFTSRVIPTVPLPANHSHPEAASDRSGASQFITDVGRNLGLIPYFFQRSRSDERKGREGSRVAFWGKDLTAQHSDYAPPETSLLAFVDVDQYVDMPTLLTKEFKPALIYTFQPSQVARAQNNSNYCFMFNENNEVVYNVTGGATYTHRVWNYSVDNLVTSRTFCGITYRTAVWLVDRRQTSPDHELILLTPISLWSFPLCYIIPYLISGSTLNYLDVVRGAFTRLMTISKSGPMMSTGRVGKYISATIPATTDEALSLISTTSKYELTMPQVLSHLPNTSDREAGAVLLKYHRDKEARKADVICPVPDSMRVYSFEPKTFEPGVPPLMSPFMNPFLHDCFVPSSGLASEVNAVARRVTDFAGPPLPLTPFLSQLIDEFITLLIPVPHTLDPYDDDYLYDQQNRPTQRSILEKAQFIVNPQRVVQSFLKKETYGGYKPPRVISTENGTDKAAYSKFIYAFADNVMKPQAWYAFGKTPAEIAERVAAVCVGCREGAANSDFIKFDGHVKNTGRILEQRSLTRAFKTQYHSELIDLHRSSMHVSAYTTEGVVYDTEETRTSGKADTAVMNGMQNSFVSYGEKRMSINPDTGTYYAPQEAYALLGIYGGDDGLSPDVNEVNYKKSAALLGHEIDVEIINKHSLGVKFLARVYSPDVWTGDTNTCCDLPRQLTKFHVSRVLPPLVTPVMKMLEKARAFILTDENTPFMGDYVRRVREIYNSPLDVNYIEHLTPWFARYPKDVQYINTPAEWMDDYCKSVLPGADRPKFLEWLRKCNSLQDLMKPYVLQEPKDAKPLDPVVAGDEILPRGIDVSKTLIIPPHSFTTGPRRNRKHEDVGTKTEPQERKFAGLSFEEFKAKRIAAGTWVEKEKPERIWADKSKTDGAKSVTAVVEPFPPLPGQATPTQAIATIPVGVGAPIAPSKLTPVVVSTSTATSTSSG